MLRWDIKSVVRVLKPTNKITQTERKTYIEAIPLRLSRLFDLRFLFLIFSFVLFSLSASQVAAGPLDDCQELTTYGIPGNTGDILCHKGYLLAHDPARKTPIWIIEHLAKEKVMGTLARKDAFKPDPDLAKGRRAELNDYKGSPYDRGHMAPAADMKWDAQAMAECFYLSNMVPQVGKGMNRGIWRILEDKVRDWAISRGEIYIYTGPVYDVKEELKVIGKNKVAVPSALFKIVFSPGDQKAIAFIMPNRSLNTKDIPKYIVSVREVEKETGLDFFDALSKETQDSFESNSAPALWE